MQSWYFSSWYIIKEKKDACSVYSAQFFWLISSLNFSCAGNRERINADLSIVVVKIRTVQFIKCGRVYFLLDHCPYLQDWTGCTKKQEKFKRQYNFRRICEYIRNLARATARIQKRSAVKVFWKGQQG